ncbi:MULTISPECIES: hypothetical protein [Treponema]|uniref:hypothetical protein n=1 Tax=Treponema TaxID=157 RepID=UPI0002B4F37B|nr:MULTISPECIES: hypothetical protein [Treponema]EMB46705.1 hypothetical protein HMPREF9729_01101 [Treponema denticola ASLM]EMD58033.1 hypothetical protein HMPREF9728_00276 [Treponema denticola US-Trep]UTD11163.1 hypothetical protein HYB91_11755 [Treponema sp. B152]
MAKNLINLDLLRSESQKVKFLGKEFEVGYIPSGLAIPLIENHNKNIKEQKESDSQEKLLKDNIKSVSLFCSFYEPDFTEEFLSKQASDKQIEQMYQLIVLAILKNFSAAVSNDDSESSTSVEKKTTGEN